MLKVENLSKQFDINYALSSVTFNVSKGESVAVVGHNGSGKSTLLNCVAKVFRPTKGSVELEADRLGILLTNIMLYAELSIEENLSLFAACLGVSSIDTEVSYLLDKLRLSKLAKKKIRECSYGMKKRAALARALLSTRGSSSVLNAI